MGHLVIGMIVIYVIYLFLCWIMDLGIDWEE